jgi:phosphohistidine phosphatase
MMLILMRHAEATSEFGIDDHTRDLSGIGQRAALDLGRWFATQNFSPTLALVSDSNRTRQSFLGLKLLCPVKYLPSLYLATAKKLDSEIQRANTECLLLIAHNPGIAELAYTLAGKDLTHPRFYAYPPGSTLVISAGKDARETFVHDFMTPEDLIS